jgi:A/G-specific adenine glycosylase
VTSSDRLLGARLGKATVAKTDRDTLLAEQLLRWYAGCRRDLPWRRTRDPYRIWISEVMLQQTRAEVVVPYYRRFLRAFPTVQALATASEQDVLRAWAGLGYYARARNLLRAAREVVRRGAFPATAAEWRRLPGVGQYTAAAVASIAFGQDELAVDSNVLRVGLRLMGLKASPAEAAARRAVETALRAVLPTGRAGDFNQALMDLGATVCLPQAPRCEACPVSDWCRAYQRGLADRLPLRRLPPPRPHRRFVAALVRDGRGRVLLVRQPSGGLWGGLWTLPYVPGTSWRQARAALERLVGVTLRRDHLELTFRHTFTHFHATFHVVGARTRGTPGAGRFAPPGRSTFPVPAPVARLLRRLAGGPGSFSRE